MVLLKISETFPQKANNSVQCSIPVVHSTVCTHPNDYAIIMKQFTNTLGYYITRWIAIHFYNY